MKPEEKARVIIDRQLAEAGWLVIDRDEYTPMVHACAVREGLMNRHGANLLPFCYNCIMYKPDGKCLIMCIAIRPCSLRRTR